MMLRVLWGCTAWVWIVEVPTQWPVSVMPSLPSVS
jgi:hypothetical protein